MRSGRRWMVRSRPRTMACWQTDFVLTRSELAICLASTSCANISAACSRTCSRRDRPYMVSPPPSAYLMTPA
jgi:hypothetical protein